MFDFRPKTPEPARPERAEAPSPGQRPGLLWMQACRPEKSKSFQVVTISYNEKTAAGKHQLQFLYIIIMCIY